MTGETLLYDFKDAAIPSVPYEETEVAKELAPTDWKFGTIIADPPWAYGNTSVSEKLSGYASSRDESKHKYSVLSTDDLCNMPVGDYASDDSVLMMWTTWPFVADALKVIDAWGFDYITGLPLVKMDSKDEPKYGVGYWVRGCTEPLLIAKRRKGKSYRSSNIGLLTSKRGEYDALLSPALSHSRKPDHQYELGETYPGPRLEVFARGKSAFDHGWYALGNEAHLDGNDILESGLWIPTWENQQKEMTK
jgi:N6-adenosine-specific RNA methylase IME4